MAEPFESWAVVEVMGHVRLAGRVTEQTIAGAAFVRVDVPALPATTNRYGSSYEAVPAFTKLLGGGSIYSITPCTEEVAIKAAATFRTTPILHVDLRTAADVGPARLTGPEKERPDEDDYDDVEDSEEETF